MSGFFSNVGFGELLGIGSGLAGSIMNFGASKKAAKLALQNAREQREWSERMANTAHQREIKDLEAAGLNPILSATGGNGAPMPAYDAAHPDAPQIDLSSLLGFVTSMKEQKSREKMFDKQLALQYERMEREDEFKHKSLDINAENFTKNYNLSVERFAWEKGTREKEISFREKQFAWNQQVDLFSQEMQKKGLGMRQQELDISSAMLSIANDRNIRESNMAGVALAVARENLDKYARANEKERHTMKGAVITSVCTAIGAALGAGLTGGVGAAAGAAAGYKIGNSVNPAELNRVIESIFKGGDRPNDIIRPVRAITDSAFRVRSGQRRHQTSQKKGRR